ncbi:MAG: hypothetical protein Q4D87_05765 [Actinomycetaceae bacterium]|nr:hypothetical protein [Actinomycetaceae bacterium]
MQELDYYPEYIVTFEGQTPEEAKGHSLPSPDYDIAKSIGIEMAYDYGHDPDKNRIFYRTVIIASTDWVEVGDDSNYEEVIEQINREFRPF